MVKNSNLQPAETMENWGLVADVGGTNIRLALIELNSEKIVNLRSFLCADYGSITDVIKDFLTSATTKVNHACIAIAGVVERDWISMTNHQWEFSISQAREDLDLKNLYLINDYTGISMAIPRLNENNKVKIGDGVPQDKKPIAVFGPGTGLGVSHLICHENQWISIDGEGGHVDYAAQDDLEDHLIQFLRQRFDNVSAEMLISGPGLVNIYNGVKSLHKETTENLTPKEITTRALKKTDPCCQEVLRVFCGMMGSFAGNLALNLGTFGGVYLAGGIVPRIVDYLAVSDFRKRFETKGRFSDYLKKIPTYVITEPQPGLIGAGAYLAQMLRVKPKAGH